MLVILLGELMARVRKACLLLFFASHAVCQSSGPQVSVPLVVFGSPHRPANVSLGSLVITDQKVPVTGAVLVPGAGLPVELGILIDTSNSRRGADLGEILKAMNQFVTETIRGPQDRVFLVSFEDTPRMSEWLNRTNYKVPL